MVHSLIVVVLALLWVASAVAQSVPGRFPSGTVYGNPGATEANPSTTQTFATTWTTATRPANPFVGQTGFNSTLGVVEVWNGEKRVVSATVSSGGTGCAGFADPFTFTGSVGASPNNTTLTVTAITGTPLKVGQYISDSSPAGTGANSNFVRNTQITAFGTGSGGTGTYTISPAQNAAGMTSRSTMNGLSAPSQRTAVVTASIASGQPTNLVVSAVTSGTLRIGQYISGTGITANTQIIAFDSSTGTLGGTGTYTVSISHGSGVASTTVTGLPLLTMTGTGGTPSTNQFIATAPISTGGTITGAPVTILSSGNYTALPSGTITSNPACTTPPTLTLTTENVWVSYPHKPYNVMNYGARCDGATDDSGAINAAIGAARAEVIAVANSVKSLAIDFPKNMPCLIRSSIDLTRIVNPSGAALVGVSIRDAYLYCLVNGNPCIDALGTQGIHWENITIWGGDDTAGSYPNYGIQIGRNSRAQAGDHDMEEIYLLGWYRNCGFINMASESSTFTHMYVSNNANTFGICQDGYNYWNVNSEYTIQNNVQYQAHSFAGNTFIGSSFYSADSPVGHALLPNVNSTPINGIPVYYSRAVDHVWIEGYAAATGGYAAIFDFSPGFNANLNLHLGVEGPGQLGPTSGMFLWGNLQPGTESNAISTSDFEWRTSVVELTGTLGIMALPVGTKPSSITITGLTLRVRGPIYPGLAGQVFEDPSRWTVTGGYIATNSALTWNGLASQFGGLVCNPGCQSGVLLTIYGPTASTTHTLNSQTSVVRFIGCGPGGGGGSGGRATSGTISGGAGGGAGGCFDKSMLRSDLAASLFVVVGTKGAGGTAPAAGANPGVQGQPGSSVTCIGSAAPSGSPVVCNGTIYIVGGFGGGGAGGIGGAVTAGGNGGCTDVRNLGSTGANSPNGVTNIGSTAGTACFLGAGINLGGAGANSNAVLTGGTSTLGTGGGGSPNGGSGNSAGASINGAGGGGGGGAPTIGSTSIGGGTGGFSVGNHVSGGSIAGSSGASPPGADGLGTNSCGAGGGGGGGWANNAGTSGSGGNGLRGGGGGGGGSAATGSTVGLGGAGGDGFLCIYEFM